MSVNYLVGLPRELPAALLSPHKLQGYWTESHQIYTQYTNIITI